ncbi:MAG TPA: substrate-binding domain-containing protein, partial [Candidatus Limnocylindrales bacterium]|nr:substrate-binding domain-containing protein [Candidatus Limnocylindrales bacterium]
DLADPVHGQLAAGVEAAAAEQGMAVFMMTGLHDLEREQRALRAFVEHRADGIVLASCVIDPTDVHELVPTDRVVFVQPDYPRLATSDASPERGVIRSDDAAGVTSTIGHLVERGYRTIAYVGAGQTPSDLTRRRAATAALEMIAARPLRAYDAGMVGWRDPSAVADALAADRPDAVICYDDKLALGLVDALREWDLDVPSDIAVAGFDGIAAARRSRPRLTTVVVPWVELGRRAVEMLAAARNGSMPRSEVMPVELVIGETTPPREVMASRRRTAEPVAGAARGRG